MLWKINFEDIVIARKRMGSVVSAKYILQNSWLEREMKSVSISMLKGE